MKLKPRSFQIFWDVHAWVGVISALLLFTMFFMGVFALFQEEVNAWTNPSHTGSRTAVEPSLTPLLDALDRQEHLVGKDRVAFMPARDGLRAYWRKGDESRDFYLSASSGRLEPVSSQLGSFLYGMHFLDAVPNGIYVAGAASMALCLVLVTGLLVHLKDIVRQWFQFRPERATRTWASDMHKVLGVFGLPFQLLYAWTGAVLCLGYVTVEPAFKASVFGGDEAAQRLARGEAPRTNREPTGKLSDELPDLDAMIARARREVPHLVPTWVGIEDVGDDGSVVQILGDVPGLAFASVSVALGAKDAALLSVQRPETASSIQRFEAWFYGLHYARFGGAGIKLLYALLALATCAVIITGNLVWLERRDRLRANLGNRLLARLTVAFSAGVVLATAAMFAANRTSSSDGAAKAGLETLVFWYAWGLAAIVPFAWRNARRSAGALLLTTAALLAVALSDDLSSGLSNTHVAVDAAIFLGFVSSLVCGVRWILVQRRT